MNEASGRCLLLSFTRSSHPLHSIFTLHTEKADVDRTNDPTSAFLSYPFTEFFLSLSLTSSLMSDNKRETRVSLLLYTLRSPIVL